MKKTVEFPIPVAPFTGVRDLREVEIRHAVLRDCGTEELEGCFTLRTYLSEEADPELKSMEGEPVQIKVLGIVYPSVAAVVSDVTAIRASDGQLYIDWQTFC